MNIKLRTVCESDLEKIMEWRMKPSVTKYMNTDPQLTLEGQKKWFEKVKNDRTCQYWVIDVDGTGIGLLGLIDIDYTNRRCSWTWHIGEEEYRGRGIAKQIQLNLYDYVFYHLKLHRLYSYILSFNRHEINNVHIKCGYKVEGKLKDHVYKNGHFIDVVVMGITVDHWEAIKQDFVYGPIEFEHSLDVNPQGERKGYKNMGYCTQIQQESISESGKTFVRGGGGTNK